MEKLSLHAIVRKNCANFSFANKTFHLFLGKRAKFASSQMNSSYIEVKSLNEFLTINQINHSWGGEDEVKLDWSKMLWSIDSLRSQCMVKKI